MPGAQTPKGLIMRSPNGTAYRVTVDDTGTLSVGRSIRSIMQINLDIPDNVAARVTDALCKAGGYQGQGDKDPVRHEGADGSHRGDRAERRDMRRLSRLRWMRSTFRCRTSANNST